MPQHAGRVVLLKQSLVGVKILIRLYLSRDERFSK
jgi:hypothetical protein